MLIKQADDKSKRLALLDELHKSPVLDPRQKDWLRTELRNLQLGIQGERDAAHYIDAYFKDSINNAVLHDLRLSVDGDVAQIDHLVVNRALRFYLFETKCFNGKVEINERGEFSVSYGAERQYGIPSPIEQSMRHERVLAKLLEGLGITGRVGTKPVFHHVVMLHPKATIRRPPTKAFNTDDVIKADQIGTWHTRFVDKLISLDAVATALNLRSSDTLREMAEQIMRQHRPVDLLALPEFMTPKPPAPQATRALGVSAEASDSTPSLQADMPAPAEQLRRKLICVACGQKISFAEGKYCWNNEARFGGFQYCRAHQSS